MNLASIIANLESMDDALCIVARRPWTPDAEAKAIALTADGGVPEDVSAAGYEYFLEIDVALEEVIGNSGDLSEEQRLAACVYYAEHDAHPAWLGELRARSG
jgi:hypothetical protein